MKAVDLHTHSDRSDGTFTPTELVNYALKKDLSAIALTDHDTTDGIREALNAASGTDLEVIPGTELSTEWNGRDIHIVGLYIDYEGPAFQDYLKKFVESRDIRNKKLCTLLKEHGIDIDYDEISKEYEGSVLTRAHYAALMLKKGYVSSAKEAFERYIGDHCPCYIPREKVTPAEGIHLIKDAGGIPILAHPILYRLSDRTLDGLVCELKKEGLMGIEALYSTYNTAEERLIRHLASKYDLLISGGSDFHGKNKPGIDLGSGKGKLFVGEDVLENIKNYRYQINRMSNTAIFADMDDTLLDSSKNISPVIKQKILDYTYQGGHFVLSSGRPVESISKTAIELGLPLKNSYIIAFNGALVYDCDKKMPVIEKRLTYEDIRFVSKVCAEMGIHVHGYGENKIISPADNEELKYYRHAIKLEYVVSPDIASAMDKPSYKLIMIDLNDHKKLEMVRDRLKEERPGLTCVFSNDKYLECIRSDVSKGNALKELCEHLGVPVKNSVAAGDAMNDIPMIEAAGCGIAMINGRSEVKEAADVITQNDNDHDGFLEVFSHLLPGPATHLS